jgi:hypothetical protein
MGCGVDVDDSTRYDPLSDVLWRERTLLSRLVFKLAVVRILLAVRGYRWLPLAADEAAGIAEELETVNGHRRGLIGRRPSTTLLDLAGTAPAPWAEILRDHRESLLVLRDQARRGAASTAAALVAARASVAAEVAGLEAQGAGIHAEILRLACEHLHEISGRAACTARDDGR